MYVLCSVSSLYFIDQKKKKSHIPMFVILLFFVILVFWLEVFKNIMVNMLEKKEKKDWF